MALNTKKLLAGLQTKTFVTHSNKVFLLYVLAYDYAYNVRLQFWFALTQTPLQEPLYCTAHHGAYMYKHCIDTASAHNHITALCS